MSEEFEATGPRIRSILHPTDLTAGGEAAFAHALKIALAGRTRLYVLHAGAGDAVVDWSAFPGVRQTLTRWGALPEGSPASEVEARLGIHLAKISSREHDPVRAIRQFVDEHDNDLMVLATQGREGLPRWLHGSVAEAAARKAEVSTLFMPPDAQGFVEPASGALAPLEIVMPVDHRPRPYAALHMTEWLCRTLGVTTATVHLVHVGEPGDMPAVSVEPGSPLKLESAARKGDVVDEILAVATRSRANLIVMATAGHQGFLDALRGSTTERVLRHAPCPVLAVPAV